MSRSIEPALRRQYQKAALPRSTVTAVSKSSRSRMALFDRALRFFVLGITTHYNVLRGTINRENFLMVILCSMLQSKGVREF